MRVGGTTLALAFVVGCLVAPSLPSLPGAGVMLVLAAAAGVGCAFPPTRVPAVFLLGALWFLAAAQAEIERQWPANRAGETVTVAGVVTDLPRRLDQTVIFTLEVDHEAARHTIPARISVRWYRPFRRIEPGTRWRMSLRLKPPVGRDNPGAFDYERYLLARRIGATASVHGRPELLADEPGSQWLDRQRQRMSDILQSETVNRDVAALKRALGVADRSGMRSELSERLRETGTAHLLAISGLHVGMVAGLAGLLAGWLGAPLGLLSSRLDRRRVGVVLGLLAALGYAGLAGFTLPTQRALIMLLVLAVSLVERRAIAPGRALLLALVAVLLFDPLSPLSIGFWLSFAAVAVLVFAFAWRPSRPGQWLTGLLRAQVVLMVGLLPLNVGVFGQIVPGALFANLVAIPLMGLVILPALLIDLASMLLRLPASPAGSVSSIGLELLTAFLGWVQGFSASHLAVATPSSWALLLAGIGAIWLIAPVGWPARGLGAVLLLPLLWPARPGLGENELEAWFLDVGNGLAVVIRTREEMVLYDTGPGDAEGSDVISGVLPKLQHRAGFGRLDRIVVSHDHRGHSGGLASVVDEDVIVYASGLADFGPCVAGQGWRSGRWRFRFLHPSAALPDLGGNSSCVLRISGPAGSVLLSGGIDADVEARLVELYDGPASTILQLPAGGHRDGSSAAFLAAVDPRFAVASVANHDRFGRVHAATRRRLNSQQVDWVATGDCGAIRIRLAEGRSPNVASMATLDPRFWKSRDGCP